MALFSSRRLEIGGDQLERVKKYCTTGKPIVACRTASHGFQNWLEFDKLILGGNYKGHYGKDIVTSVKVEKTGRNHPILTGVGDLASTASLYKTGPLADDCTLLLSGETAKSGGPQPLAWTRVVNGGRVFYTSLGAPSDFANPPFRRMLANALFWAADRKPQRQ